MIITMKSIFKTLLCLVSFLVPVTGLFAQVGEEQDVPDVYHYPDNEDGTGLVYSKIVQGPNEKGEYTIFLKSFVTGEVEESEIKVPAEIVLVLDVSGSMEWGMSDSDYQATSKTSWTPRDISDFTDTHGYDVLYKRGKDDYYWIRVEEAGGYYNRTYRAYITIDGTKYYLTSTGSLTTSTNQAYTRTADQTIYSQSLYTVIDASHNRLSALKEAVNYFIDKIDENSATLGDGKTNKIAIVKFSTGAQVVNNFLSSSDSRLKTNVAGLSYGGSTYAHNGMDEALTLIKSLYTNPSSSNPTPREQTNKMVVFFTDGEPTTGAAFEDDVANSAITTAKTMKGYTSFSITKADGTTVAEKVKVYTIGTFSNPSERVSIYMNRLSSNYPNATGIGTGQGGEGSDLAGYSFMASNKQQLINAFAAISNDVVTADITVNSSSTVVDVMSKSFTLPTGTDPSTVQVWETNAQSYNNTTKQYEFSADKDDWRNITEAQGLILTVDEATNKVTVSGWAFDKNACARKSNGSVVGKQLILEIPIEMGPNAVGGPGVGTNGAGSGISYVDEHGVTQTLHFETPNIGLPINIHIRKEGLQLGESAKFTIQRMWDGESDIPDDVVITPDTWEDYTSVFVTRRSTNTESGDNAPIVKIVGLHPGFIYRIKEEGWSWSYGVSRVHGSKYTINPETHVETTEDITMNNGTQADWSDNTVLSTSINLNPFIFVNAKKDVESSVVSVRHAESIVTNDFKDFGDTGTKTGVTVNSKTQPE